MNASSLDSLDIEHLRRMRRSSKHWANYLYHPPWSGKDQRALMAEVLFFYWFMGGRNG